MRFFLMSCPKDRAIQKSGSQTKRCALQPAHRHADRVTTVGTFSGFLDFFSINLSSRIGPITRSCFGARVLLNKINQFPGLKQRQLCVAQPKQYFQKNSQFVFFSGHSLPAPLLRCYGIHLGYWYDYHISNIQKYSLGYFFVQLLHANNDQIILYVYFTH